LLDSALSLENFIHVNQGRRNFPKIEEPLQNSRHLNGDMKQVPY